MAKMCDLYYSLTFEHNTAQYKKRCFINNATYIINYTSTFFAHINYVKDQKYNVDFSHLASRLDIWRAKELF